jgi:ABC-type Mn2+/Zn2+ transport system permease subunit
MLCDNFFEAVFKYTFLQRALFTSIIVGVICGLVGVFIILRGLIFMGAGIAHSSFAGGALGILLGINPFVTIFFFSTGAALTIGFINEKGYVEDNNVAVGIIFSLTMALAILFISLIRTYNAAVTNILFGNVLVVTTEDMILLIFISIIIMMIIFFMKKELFFITFDDEMASATGIPVKFISYIFLILISFAIVVSLKAIGAILVFAMITTPAAAAYQWSYKLNRILLLSILFGAISSSVGLYLSYILNLPSGSMITMTISVIFIISIIFSPKRRAGKDIGYKHTCKVCDKVSVEECEFCLAEEQNKHQEIK